ncbi:MAG: VOC family protein [Alphaproteobacteria bacterium]|jgi:uncharacterized glyoxalase superfamily protein PhnB|nr:VOC family protein [Alphaproteobacteria bacterium]
MKITTTPQIFTKNAPEALKLYSEIFNAKIVNLHYTDEIPGMAETEGFVKEVMHSEIHVNDKALFYVSEGASEDKPYRKKTVYGDNITININFETREDLVAVFDKFKDSKDATVLSPIMDSFWGSFASVKDSFNVVWQLTKTNR